jgi:hypothetical protein
MGVQKSRKSLKFTKYSLKKKIVNLSNFSKKKIIQKIILKFKFKKNDIFFLKKKETNLNLFY